MFYTLQKKWYPEVDTAKVLNEFELSFQFLQTLEKWGENVLLYEAFFGVCIDKVIQGIFNPFFSVVSLFFQGGMRSVRWKFMAPPAVVRGEGGVGVSGRFQSARQSVMGSDPLEMITFCRRKSHRTEQVNHLSMSVALAPTHFPQFLDVRLDLIGCQLMTLQQTSGLVEHHQGPLT